MSSAMLELLSSSGSNESLAWMFCIAGGLLAGSYPVFIKVPRVIDAKVHPVVFQCYKSLAVSAIGLIFLLANALRHKPLLTFTHWGIVGASFWVPAGLSFIAAVPKCGMATTTVLNTGVNSVIQFVVSINTNQVMKTYGASQVPLAPVYLAALILGMMGLILSPALSCGSSQKANVAKDDHESLASTVSPSEDNNSLLSAKPAASETRRDFVIGVLLAALSGTLGGGKFAITNVAHQVEEKRQPEEILALEFGVFESYMISFGIGVAVSTIALVLIFALLQKGIRQQEMPPAQFGVMKIYGILAGALYGSSYICMQAANNVGGSGSFGPAGNACQLITAGLWGMLYYREVKEPKRFACWVVSAAWSIAFVVLLAGALETKPHFKETSLLFL